MRVQPRTSASAGGGRYQAPPLGTTGAARATRRFVGALLLVSGTLTVSYAGLSLFIAARMAYAPPEPLTTTPAALGLTFRAVTFRSRGDNVPLRGWYLPGLLTGGRLTVQRTIIVVHGARANRADPSMGLLDLEAALARHGLGVLAFDLRGMGESAPAPLSMGYFEQRDVLGAVDFLRSGRLPYPRLGRPRIIGGWGVSMGGATLLLAAAHEPAIRAVVADSAYADITPITERELPARSGLPQAITPGVVAASWLLYGIDPPGVRPVDSVADLAPRPLFIIQGRADTFNRPANAPALAAAARGPHAHVQVWLVPGATHGQAFHVAGPEYVRRVVDFFRTALDLDTGRREGAS